MEKTILKMEGVSKSFPGVKALDGAAIEVREGEVHALMGENGAGKSTFMKILNGLLEPDEGSIEFAGQKVRIHSPSEALKLGIAMIYQELNPIKDMTIADNIFLGREYTRGNSVFVDKGRAEAEADKLLKEFGMPVGARTHMRELSIAQMQMIEIIKAVSSGAKLIVMDEPTSSLTDEEITILFQTIHDLKQNNVAVIYISHRLEEIFQIADTVTVLRDGKYIDSKKTEALDRDSLINMMVGRMLDNIFPKKIVGIGNTVLEVKNLTRKSVFEDISFNVRAGEIVGFYGLVGAGRSEVMRAVFGLDRADCGEIWMDGRRIRVRKPQDAIANGIALVTEDRKDTGLVLCRSIRENIALPSLGEFCRGAFLDKEKESERCKEIAGRLTVKMSGLAQEAGNLSGGNQQKVVLCKWMMKSPKLLILDEPTRGIDVGAKAEIHSLMGDFAKAGMAIVMISSELPEIIGMSDRIIVMGEGKIKGEFKIGEYSQDDILKCALGGKKQ